MLAIVLALIGFGVYMWEDYNDLLVGQVKLETSSGILTHLEKTKFEHIKKLFETRQNLPYPPDNLPNPFFVPSKAPPPAPPPSTQAPPGP